MSDHSQHSTFASSLLIVFAFFTLSIIPLRGQQQIPFLYQLNGEPISQRYTNQLVLIDFWATWCAPCIMTFDHLDRLQAEYPQDLLIISMTNEPYGVVESFMKRHRPKSIIMIDANGVNHEHFNVRHIPYAVLLSRDGLVIWEGNPADLTSQQLRQLIYKQPNMNGHVVFAEQIRATHPGEELWIERVLPEGLPHEKYDYRYSEHYLPFSIAHDQKGNIIYQGDVRQLVSALLPEHLYAINTEDLPKSYWKIRIPESIRPQHAHVLNDWLQVQSWGLVKRMEEITAYHMNVVNPELFWSSDRITLDYSQPSMYMVSDEQIECDNMSFHEFHLLLSQALSVPVLISREVYGIYDWDVHIRYFDLMKSQLWDEYGIELTKKDITHQVYYLKPIAQPLGE